MLRAHHVLNAFLLTLGSCLDCCFSSNPCETPSPADGLAPTFVLTFESLSTKTLPAQVEDDGDGKDVLVKDRVKFKGDSASTDEPDKRLRLKSKKAGGEACIASEVEFTGDMTARVRVAVDSVEGLVDGQSLGFLLRRPAGGGPADGLEAVWTEGLDGLTVRAIVDDVVTGDPLEMPGYRDASLIIWDIGDDLLLQAAGNGAPGSMPPSGTLASAPQDGGDENATFAFGARGLDPLGTFWFSDFRIEFGLGANPGKVETDVTAYLALAHLAIEDAEFWLTAAPSQQSMDAVYYSVNAAADWNGSAWQSVLQALDADTLLPTTDGETLQKIVKSAQGLLIPASQDLFKLIQKGGVDASPVKGHMKSAKKKVEVALALANGFKSSSHGKVLKAMSFSIE